MPNGKLRDRDRINNCQNCYYWNTSGYEIADEEYDQCGDCERFPPRDNERGMSYGYPETTSDQWCGEFKPNPLEDDITFDVITEREEKK